MVSIDKFDRISRLFFGWDSFHGCLLQISSSRWQNACKNTTSIFILDTDISNIFHGEKRVQIRILTNYRDSPVSAVSISAFFSIVRFTNST